MLVVNPNQYLTEQEQFWAGEFGKEYIDRNNDEMLVAHNISLFAEALRRSGPISSVLELGCNVGLNLSALRTLYPTASLSGVEINGTAANIARSRLPNASIHEGSLLANVGDAVHDLVVIKGVLIHIAPESLADAYAALHRRCARWILLCEYYNPQPVEVPYRGHSQRLFKRDFAGELLDTYDDLELYDYGFRYRRDNTAPAGDLTWFLLRKTFES
jgi:pseudaminic acid biosynthesis-associated methylase